MKTRLVVLAIIMLTCGQGFAQTTVTVRKAPPELKIARLTVASDTVKSLRKALTAALKGRLSKLDRRNLDGLNNYLADLEENGYQPQSQVNASESVTDTLAHVVAVLKETQKEPPLPRLGELVETAIKDGSALVEILRLAPGQSSPGRP